MNFIANVRAVLRNKRNLKPSLSFSQEGEDMVLSRIFASQSVGFYVDVGAHHPIRFSNTYKLYMAGWHGVNIEPNPDAFDLFHKFRSRDINLNCGVAIQTGFMRYFMFDEPALNTFDKEVVKQRLGESPYKLVKQIEVKVGRLKDILDETVAVSTHIDFLSIDVEGLDLEVLKSNDWQKYRPSWVLVEQLNLKNIEILDFELHHYMKSIGYVLFAKTFNTLFYKDKTVSL